MLTPETKESGGEPIARAALWRALNRIDGSKINSKWMALRNATAVALPLAIGIALGNPLGAVAVTTGALNVAYSDGADPYTLRARRMLLWSFLGALAVFLGSVTGRNALAAVCSAALWAFVAGMCASLSVKAGDLGLNTLVALIVFAARGALPLEGAMIAAALVLAGGLLQTCVALLLWPLQPNEPERRALAKVYSDLASEVRLRPESQALVAVPPLNAQAQDAVSALGRDHSVEGERFRLLFDQADRIRLSVFRLSRLHAEWSEGEHPNEAVTGFAALFNELFALCSELLAQIALHLTLSAAEDAGKRLLPDLQRLVERAHTAGSAENSRVAAAVDILAGQLRSASELASRATQTGRKHYIWTAQTGSRNLPFSVWATTIKANLDWRSAFFRHAVRLAVCVALSDAIGRSISWQRTYWIPMTVAVILKPDFTTTISRGVLRLAGTFTGLFFATLLYHLLPASPWRQFVLVSLFTFLLRWLGPANYGVFSFAVSGLIVFLIAATGITPSEVVWSRGLNTLAGGILALLAYLAWPTWERTQVGETVALMLDASRNYMQALLNRFERPNAFPEDDLSAKRTQWRLTRSNAEASVDRVSTEPGITGERLDCFTSILASSHALIHAMIGLEAGLLENLPLACPAPFAKFSHDVEFTLYFLSQALRGSKAAAGILPDLREDHRALVESRESFPADDHFVLIETDRMTVSLNTLREQVLKCLL